MEIVAFIEARQRDVTRKIPEHFALWQDPPSSGSPSPTRQAQPGEAGLDRDSRLIYEPDPDFPEYGRCEQQERPELAWGP